MSIGHELDAGLAKSCLDCRWLGTTVQLWAAVFRPKYFEAKLGPGPWCHAAQPCVGMSEWMPPETEGGR